ncbi:MAG TPA: amidohydrolase [Acidobacteriota bacterium]|nr:amidohydrolase [Acidobacteriota bacterium]
MDSTKKSLLNSLIKTGACSRQLASAEEPWRGRLILLKLMLVVLVTAAGCSEAPQPQQEGQGSGAVEESSEDSALTVDLLIEKGAVLTMDEEFTYHPVGYVAVKGDEIVEVGAGDVPAEIHGVRRIDASGHFVLPGLINGHQHAPMTVMRGVADDLALMDWLQNYIFPAEAANVDEEMVYWGTLLAAMEMIRGGTTLYVDMYYYEDKVAEATARAGMRGILGETILDFPVPDAKDPKSGIEAAKVYLAKWKDHPLIIPAIAPHSPYTCSTETLLACKAAAEEFDVPLVIHVAETQDELRQVKEKSGTTPVRYLRDIGFLDQRVIAAHTVWVDAEEIALMKQFGVGPVHNPESNMKLASGVAPVPDMLDAGLAVGIGTDGPASNNNLDLLDELDSAAKLHKIHRMDPTVLSARQALAMATRLGAQAVDMDHLVGSLEIGKKADLILIKSDGLPQGVPSFDPYSSIVYSLGAEAVVMTVVNGSVVFENGSLTKIDEAEVYSKVAELSAKLRSSLEK